MARAPITKQQFETIIKPKLKEYNKALDDWKFAKYSEKRVDNAIELSELVIRKQTCWIVKEVSDRQAGTGYIRLPLVAYGYSGTDTSSSASLKYGPDATEFWDLKIRNELLDSVFISDLEGGGKISSIWELFGSRNLPIQTPNYLLNHPKRFSFSIKPINWQQPSIPARPANMQSPASKVGYISLHRDSTANPFNNHVIDRELDWYNKDINFRSLTINVWARPIEHFNKADLSDPEKVRVFKNSFKDDEGSPLNRIWASIQEEIRVTKAKLDSKAADLRQTLIALGSGISLEDLPEKEDTWSALCLKNNWAVLNGDISISSGNELFQDIFIKDLSDKVRYFKGYTPDENKFIRVNETFDDITVTLRTTQETVVGTIGGVKKRFATISYKDAGRDETGQPLTTFQEIANPTTQQNVEINADKHTLALLWCIRAYISVRRIATGIVTDKEKVEYSDKQIVTLPDAFYMADIALEENQSRHASFNTAFDGYSDSDNLRNVPLLDMSNKGAGRPTNDTKEGLLAMLKLKERLRGCLLEIYTGLLTNVNFTLTGNEPPLPASGEGLVVAANTRLLQQHTEIDPVLLNQYFNQLKEIVDNYFGRAKFFYNDPEFPDYEIRLPIDFKACHSSCHGSCHGSRGRR